MRLITTQEVELVKTFSLSLKMKNHGQIVEHFRNKYENQPDDPETVFNYGICMCIYIFLDTDNANKSKHQLEANKALTRCLSFHEDWWLVRFLRSEVNQEIPTGLIEMSNQIKLESFQKADPDEDRRILISQQQNCSLKPSYFLCPYISQAKSHIYQGQIGQAVESFREGLSLIPVSPINFNMRYLTQPFYDLIVYFRKLNMAKEAGEVKEVALTLFPSSKVLFMT